MTTDRLPLRGRHVLITRGGEQGEKFCNHVASSGGIPYMVPLIDFRPHEDLNANHFIQSLSKYDWIIFTSKNGVKYFFQQIDSRREQFEMMKDQIQFAAVGEKTRAELSRYRVESHFMPNIYTAEDFSREFFEKGFTAKRALIPKGNLARTTIADSFRSHRIVADEWIVYETFYPTKDIGRLVNIIKEDRLDVACFTSPSTFHHFNKVVKQYHLEEHVQSITFASIGKVTKSAIEDEGHLVKVCPEKYTIDSMFHELCQYFGQKRKEE
ncbi:MAG TPA: uroporphyrinogen-III synthase [Bacillus bacterium]|uniref:Uroporphyrinogen-III synthase n=1 Tax=Siminovitchia fordii TaxID=254759 RepID=A0ABQ4KAE2_9BACI|nr:uroporphyrinogen-III synthase [Siminovitchia fordii]GIN22690.1 uroporphyrinogen-III synthase [Siminovitchia fordii]HBZ09602.1 uroporphyrinogen-III synthase [Bacillus sp. (in: firmicutes)]